MIDLSSVAEMACPTSRIEALGILIDPVSMGQEGDICSPMALAGRDDADLSVAMFLVVPLDKGATGAGIRQAGNRFVLEGRRVL